MTDKKEITKRIKELAFEAGFNACGITSTEPLQKNAEVLKEWIAQGFNADLNFLENHFEKRSNPSLLVPGSKSVIICLISYNYKVQHKSVNYKISKYIAGKDYHEVIREKLNSLLDKIMQEFNEIKGRAFVDTAPLMEKPLAMRAGLGWIGKNGLLINKEFGSFCFIGSLIINTELEYDKPETSHCGECNLCVDACPTKAFVNPSLIDLKRCIAYNTIEYKGCIPEDIRKNLSGWVYGCDACQEICPWNKKSKTATATEFSPTSPLLGFNNADWENITEEQFKLFSKHSALNRTTFERFQRNINAIKNNCRTN